MDMVERVARALALDRAEPWESMQEGDQQSWLGTARATIEAMRDPTDEMLLAIWEKQQGHDFTPDEESASEWYGDMRDLRAGFNAAIDTALKEKPPA